MLRSMFSSVGLIVLMTLVSGALAESISESSASGSAPVYGDLTDKEDCVTNLMLAFRDRDIERFKEVLHQQYVFHFAAQDMSLVSDLSLTKAMFENAIVLGMVIRPGEWRPTTSVFGKECAECWESERGYVLVASVPGNDPSVTMFRGKYKIVVTSVAEGENTRYKILALGDVDTGLEPQTASAPN